MLYLTCTTITSVDLAHYGVSRAKDWVSVYCGTTFSWRPTNLENNRARAYWWVGGRCVWCFLGTFFLSFVFFFLFYLPLCGRWPNID